MVMTEDLAAWLHDRLESDRLKAETLKAGAEVLRVAYPRYAALAVELADLVLADCDAKRQIISEHGFIYRDIGFLEEDDDELVDATEEIPVCGRCVPKHSAFNRREEIPVGPCRTVRLLAVPFAGLPGYRDEWRP